MDISTKQSQNTNLSCNDNIEVSVKLEDEISSTHCNINNNHNETKAVLYIKTEPEPHDDISKMDEHKNVLGTVKKECDPDSLEQTNNEREEISSQRRSKRVKREVRTSEKQYNYRSSVIKSFKQRSEKVLLCDKCKFKTTRKSELIKHQSLHAELKTYSCTFCNKPFTIRLHLDEHLLYTHRNQINVMDFITSQIHQCSKCSYQTLRVDQLQTHMLNHKEHMPEELFSCETCDYTSYHKGNYTQHLSIHSNRKQFVCSVCGKRFNQKVQLNSHIVNHHSDDANLMATLKCKILECPQSQCSYRCVMNTQLQNHIKSNH